MVIVLVAIGVITLMAIGEYFIIAYWWLLMIIILMIINEYFIMDIGGY
jgi:hypothetical protein